MLSELHELHELHELSCDRSTGCLLELTRNDGILHQHQAFSFSHALSRYSRFHLYNHSANGVLVRIPVKAARQSKQSVTPALAIS